MIVIDVDQGSEQWLNARKGRATASEFNKILTPLGKMSSQSVGYMRKLARECVCDDPLEFSGNKYMDWGTEHEDEARKVYQELTGNVVKEVGFCCRDDRVVGCSPDGLIIDESGEYIGGLEIKCPSVDKHIEYLMEGVLPKDYKIQVHGSMAVTGLPWWDFMSYFPGLNPLIIRVERDSFTESVYRSLDNFVIEYSLEREKVLKKIIIKK